MRLSVNFAGISFGIIHLLSCHPNLQHTHSARLALNKTDSLQNSSELLDTNLDYLGCEKLALQWLKQELADTQRSERDGKFVKVAIDRSLISGKTIGLVYYSMNDSTNAFLIYQKEGNNWSILRRKSYINRGLEKHLSFPFIVTDFNGDGKKDVFVERTQWEIHFGMLGDIWLNSGADFKPAGGIKDIVTPRWDPQIKRILSYQSTGCADMNKHFEVYYWENDSLIWERAIDLVACDILDEKSTAPYCEIYENTVRKGADWEERKKSVVRWDSIAPFTPGFYGELTLSQLRTVRKLRSK